MAYRQKYKPNVGIKAARGWCLKYVDDAGKAPTRRPNARAALDAEIKAKRLRTSVPPIDVWVVGFLDLRAGQWAGDDHVFFMKRLSNGKYEIRDSEVQAGARGVYRSIAEIVAWFGAYKPVYVGWSTHCDGRQYVEEYTPKPTKKSNAAIAEEVLAGKWGNGNDRLNALTKAGYNYAQVQAEVNKLVANRKKPAPAPTKKYHTVKRGDTMWDISLQYKTTLPKLAKLNPSIKNLNQIDIGQKIRVK